METASPSKPFLGVRFVLFGFDTIGERQVRAKLIDGGGVDAGEYSENCTHVIVDKIVYNDPVCITARNDGKTLVTGLWVDHSYDIGMAVDATSIMYKPLRDLNGIHGAKSLVVCLTGYQRQDRDDIMTMGSLMGAQFSKPLVANKVTHLVCYKFEGEKYELAYKLKKIKLVNHRWLEDCLRDWELLPEDNYSKSGYELEMMEAEAKDSDEDADYTNEKQSSCKMANKSPQLKIGTPTNRQMHRVNGDGPNMSHNISDMGGSQNVNKPKDMLVTSGKMASTNHATAAHTHRGSAGKACYGTSGFNDATSVALSGAQEKTPISKKVGNCLESVSRSYERPGSDAKFSPSTYPRKTSSPSSIFSGELSNIEGSTAELGQSIKISSGKVECANDLVGSYAGDILKRREQVITEGSSSKKQKLHSSFSNLDVQNVILDARESMASINGKIQSLELENSVHGQSKTNNLSPLVDHDGSKNEVVSLHVALHADVSAAESSESQKKPVTHSPQSHEDVTQRTKENETMKEKTSEEFYKGLTKFSSNGNPEDLDIGVQKSEHAAVDAGLPWNQQQNKEVPSPCNSISKTEKLQAEADTEELKERNDNLNARPGRKKTIARRTLGARPKLRSTANQKGSIYLNKAAAQDSHVLNLSAERNNPKNSCGTELEISAETVNISKDYEADATAGMKSGDNNGSETNSMDDKIEAPKDKYGPVDVFNLEEPEEANLSNKVHGDMENTSEGSQHAANSNMDDSPLKEKNAPQILHKDESTRRGSGTKGKASKGRKQASGETRARTVPPVSKLAGPQIAKEEEKVKPCSAGQSKTRPLSEKKIRKSREVEKENEPILDGNQNISRAKALVGNDAGSAKSDEQATKVKQLNLKHLKSEDVWFIYSGHRLERKEFRLVIKRLKGKICRDSHQWSYQATHFIAPDPIRRTEKFFAAAASGRWILKTDYLTACSQAGKFLPEEPYEWHKNGLSEDGAINLVAPRKWRLLREKTGHGAFYGMRIIIYGECIAPPLDTLKRVVKAGDGTILATSPPYARFLTTGVDYAIVCAGMPRADMWVQEFIRHEIPCVVPDYLVEYVCKPGYSLDRHVLYNTHTLAEKSFTKLLGKAEEILEDFLPSDDSSGSNDIACKVCGSLDREDVMLICGDESGSVGCGIAMHIDCCDPPLKEIPEDDWFCPSCRNRNSNSCKRRKAASSSVSN